MVIFPILQTGSGIGFRVAGRPKMAGKRRRSKWAQADTCQAERFSLTGHRAFDAINAIVMPDLTQLALYFAAALLLAVTPGPGIFYVAARTLAGGRAEGVASSFGTGLGGMVHVLAGSVGVSAIVLASAELFTALKLIGAAYLIWIGFRTLQSARRDGASAV